MEEKERKLKELKLNLRENVVPMFSEDDLLFYLDKYKGDVRAASYECLLLKAETTGLNVSGLTTKDSSGYFKMLASHYIPTNSGVLKS